MITKEQVEKYKIDTTICPFCGSNILCTEDSNMVEKYTEKKILCNSCGKRWIEVHEIIDIKEVEEDTEEWNE